MVSFLNSIDDEKKAVMKMKVSYKTPETPKEQRTLNIVMRAIEETFNSAGITKRDGDMYIGNGDDRDYAAFGKAAIALMQEVSLLKYIDEWLYYDEYGDVCDCGAKSKKDTGLLPLDAPDKTMYQEAKLSVMKMEIRYKKAENEREQRSLNNLIKVVDGIFRDCGISKKEGNHVYIGNGDEHDYARFGMVYEALNGWIAFLKRVEIWNFHNEYGELEDFATSCKEKAGIL